MSTDLTHEVAEALYAADPAKRGRFCCDKTFRPTSYKDLRPEDHAYYQAQAEAAIPVALRWAQKAIAGEDTIEWAQGAHGSSISLPDAMDAIQSLQEGL